MGGWRGPEVEGEFPTLGYEIAEWIEENVVVPDGDHVEEPFVVSDEQLLFLLHFYRVWPDALERVMRDAKRRRPNRAFFHTRGGLMILPQKAGKGPFAAANALAEAMGPVIFDGWNATGEPVGRPWKTPLIACTAQSEDQSKNVWDALYAMVTLGDLKADIPDTGVTRINLPNGGRIQPVTASAKSRQGARITFAVQDEVQDWTQQNKGKKLADTQYRSLAGMGGRFLQTGNAWDPNLDSVAQQTYESGVGVYKMLKEAGAGDIRDPDVRMELLEKVYDGSPWVQLDLISETIDDFISRGDVAQAERFFLNRRIPSEDTAFSLEDWKKLAAPETKIGQAERIVVGVDGARYVDALAMIATHVLSGHQWPLGIWEKPERADEDYEHPMDEVDGALREAMDFYDVWRVYIDPGSQLGNITPLMDKWQGTYGEKRVVAWPMNRPRATAYMIRNYVSAVLSGDLTHDGDEAFARHIANARRKPVNVYDEDSKQMYVLAKEAPASPLKIDAAAAGALSWEARGDAIAAGTVNVSVYDDPVNKCAECGHLRRHHADRKAACNVRTCRCRRFAEPETEE